MTYAAYKCDLRRMQPSVSETAYVLIPLLLMLLFFKRGGGGGGGITFTLLARLANPNSKLGRNTNTQCIKSAQLSLIKTSILR